jgi:hypothetical protein
LWTICLGRLWTVILQISAYWVARIADVSHHHPGSPSLFWLVWLRVCWSCLYFSKNQLFILHWYFVIFKFSILLLFAPMFTIFFCLLISDLAYSCFSKSLKCTIYLFESM